MGRGGGGVVFQNRQTEGPQKLDRFFSEPHVTCSIVSYEIKNVEEEEEEESSTWVCRATGTDHRLVRCGVVDHQDARSPFRPGV